MNLARYYFRHVFPTGLASVKTAFSIWSDLMTGNYTNYALLKDDDPETECREWFWASLGEDEVLSKEFLEHLEELIRRIDSGEEKLISIDDLLKNLDEQELSDGDV